MVCPKSVFPFQNLIQRRQILRLKEKMSFMPWNHLHHYKLITASYLAINSHKNAGRYLIPFVLHLTKSINLNLEPVNSLYADFGLNTDLVE